MATSTDRPPRPRVRVLHADPDKAPVLVIDRWASSPPDLDAVRHAGFSGVLAFSMDVDLDDDGLDDPGGGQDITRELAALEDAARDAVRAAEGTVLSGIVVRHVDRLRDALAGLDATRTPPR